MIIYRIWIIVIRTSILPEILLDSHKYPFFETDFYFSDPLVSSNKPFFEVKQVFLTSFKTVQEMKSVYKSQEVKSQFI